MKLIEFINFKNDDQRYIRALEKEVIRLTAQCKRWADLQSGKTDTKIVETDEGMVKTAKVKPHFTETWQYSKQELDAEVFYHLRAKGFEIGERPNMRVIKSKADVQWIEEMFPNLYFKQMQLAYGRIAARASNRKRRNAEKIRANDNKSMGNGAPVGSSSWYSGARAIQKTKKS